mmetsp:Transcript_25425/g.42280  ORF Transcript_25425/g.42280 Transcript_25425/m.42280 type:complete len:215 (-) Transcript_25425:97-741(-)
MMADPMTIVVAGAGTTGEQDLSTLISTTDDEQRSVNQQHDTPARPPNVGTSRGNSGEPTTTTPVAAVVPIAEQDATTAAVELVVDDADIIPMTTTTTVSPDDTTTTAAISDPTTTETAVLTEQLLEPPAATHEQQHKEVNVIPVSQSIYGTSKNVWEFGKTHVPLLHIWMGATQFVCDKTVNFVLDGQDLESLDQGIETKLAELDYHLSRIVGR